MQISKEEFNRIKDAQNEAFIRIDKNKDSIIKLTERQTDFIAELKDFKIDDITQDEEIKKKIQAMASSSGRKTAFKWIAGIVPAVEIIRQVLENI